MYIQRLPIHFICDIRMTQIIIYNTSMCNKILPYVTICMAPSVLISVIHVTDVNKMYQTVAIVVLKLCF